MSQKFEHKEYHTWRWDRLKCRAYTRSEARGLFKKMEGLDRLPVGANVVLVSSHPGPMPR